MIVRELSYILNRVPSDGDVKFWLDGPHEYGGFLNVDDAVWDTSDRRLILSENACMSSPGCRDLSGIRPGNLDLQILFIAAFRYALGRMTYVVPTIAGMIKDNIGYLTENTINLMIKEIENGDARGGLGLGMDVDKEIWLSLKAELRSELEQEAGVPINSNILE